MSEDTRAPERAALAALDAALRDISEWVQLAKRQTREIPNYGFVPWAPTDAGIVASERVMKQVADAAILLLVSERERALRLLRRSDGQGNTHYAVRLAAEAEGIESVLDKLAALSPMSSQEGQ
jgi:hypothetical protein